MYYLELNLTFTKSMCYNILICQKELSNQKEKKLSVNSVSEKECLQLVDVQS